MHSITIDQARAKTVQIGGHTGSLPRNTTDHVLVKDPCHGARTSLEAQILVSSERLAIGVLFQGWTSKGSAGCSSRWAPPPTETDSMRESVLRAKMLANAQ